MRKLFKFSLHKGNVNEETIWNFQAFMNSKKNSCRTMGQTASKRPETSILEWISPILVLMVLIHPYGSPWVRLVPKSHYKLIELIKFTRYVARTHMQFSPISPFQWNHYIELHDSSDVLDSRGRRGILRKERRKYKILLRSQVKFYIFYMSPAKYPCDR